MSWNNLDGRFSPRNPLSPYYGKLSRNTPVRISIPAESAYLRMASNDKSTCTTPSGSLTGDLDVRIDVELYDHRAVSLISKWQPWSFNLEADGTLSLEWAPSSGNGLIIKGNTPVPLGRIALRAVLSLSGSVSFYTAASISSSWTLLESFGFAATTLKSTASPLIIGAGLFGNSFHGVVTDYQGLQGRVYAASVSNGGTTVASPDFTTATAGGATLTDAQGNVWTLTGTAEFSNRDYRYSGECAALPQQWDREDVWANVSAAGILRRINQNNAPLDSPFKRGYLRLSGAIAPVAYWPCEDGSSAQSIAAAIGGQAMSYSNAPNLASNSDFVASLPIPVLNGSTLVANVPPYTAGPDIVVRFLLSVPASGDTDGGTIMRVYTTGTVRIFAAIYHTGGTIEITGSDSSGNQLFSSGHVSFGLNGVPVRLSMELRQSGSNINYSMVSIQPGATTGSGFSGTVTSATLGHVKQLMSNPSGSLTQTAIGHISFQSTWDSLFDLTKQLNAYQAETATDRFTRLCSEENIASRIYGPSALAVEMGAQSSDTLFNLLQECEATDGGMMYELLDTPGLGYRTSNSMASQPPAVSLDYSLDQLSPPLTPADDDQYTQNDVTVSRNNGSSARAVLDDGSTMSISPPPVGVGSYVTSFTANTFLDEQLADQAAWRLHLGTVNEERYPSVVIDLTDRDLASLFYDVTSVRVGDTIKISNLPPFLPPGDIRAIVFGQTEVLGDFQCKTTWQTQPASPWDVLVAGSGAASDCHADTSGSSLHAGLTTTATSVQVDTDSGNALWTTSGADFPFDIAIGGERMTVTGISGTSSPQTFTVTRSVNGVVKTHSAGESVSLFQPVYAALA